MQDRGTFRIVWDGDSEEDCVEVCHQLKGAGIVYRVAQQPVSRSIRMRVDWRYRVCVLESDYEPARVALGLDAEADAEIENHALEMPENVCSTSEFSQAENERRSAGSYLKPWNPENATVEVWWQVVSNTPSFAEHALRENLIHYRLQCAENGRCKLFVSPEDEHRAREILREIEKGEPPG